MTLQTDLGELLGTLPYMSPEQVQLDPAELDVRSDVYALGVIMYELLAGKLPHDMRGMALPELVHTIVMLIRFRWGRFPDLPGRH